MPKQIFFFSKKLGLHPKEVLAKARELGIVQAKVSSSWVDDVYLAQLNAGLLKDHPNLAAKLAQKNPDKEPNEKASRSKPSTNNVNNSDTILLKATTALLGTQSDLAAALHGCPKFIVAMSEKEPAVFVKLAMFVWLHSDQFIRWPKKAYCFWPGQVRASGTGRTPCYEYSQEQLALIRQAGLEPRAWNNDPAIFAFKLAGGDRPQRTDLKWEWTIHHIYDGKYEAQMGWPITHAVKHPAYFTEAAGLVALHPIADSLASEVAFFAWLLRHEAFQRFGFDPDGVFGRL